MRHRYQAAAVRCGNKACVSSRSAAGVGCSRNEHAITFAHAKIACRQNVRSLERMHQQHPDRPTADALDRNEVRDQRLVVHRVGITPSIALCAIAWMVAAQKPQARSCPGSKAAIRAAAGNIDPAVDHRITRLSWSVVGMRSPPNGYYRNIPFSFDDASMPIWPVIDTPALILVSKSRD
jgi:hypothetical protein